MMRRALLLVMLAAAFAPAPPSDHAKDCPRECKTCGPALDRALAFIQKSGLTAEGYGRYAEASYAGFAFAAAGSTPTSGPYASDLKRIIPELIACPSTNWYLGLGGLFLTEAYARWPTPELRARLEQIVKELEAAQEPNGGWCHSKGFKYPVAGKRGDIADLGILSGPCIAVLCNCRALGIAVPDAVLERAWKYCDATSDGGGLYYAAGNPVEDFSGSRGAIALLGMDRIGRTDLKHHAAFLKGIRSRYDKVEKSHNFTPIHYFNVAVALHYFGDGPKFQAKYRDALLGMQESDGSIWLPTEETRSGQNNYEKANLGGRNVCSTAVFATILALPLDHLWIARPCAVMDRSGRVPHKVEWKAGDRSRCTVRADGADSSIDFEIASPAKYRKAGSKEQETLAGSPMDLGIFAAGKAIGAGETWKIAPAKATAWLKSCGLTLTCSAGEGAWGAQEGMILKTSVTLSGDGASGSAKFKWTAKGEMAYDLSLRRPSSLALEIAPDDAAVKKISLRVEITAP